MSLILRNRTTGPKRWKLWRNIGKQLPPVPQHADRLPRGISPEIRRRKVDRRVQSHDAHCRAWIWGMFLFFAGGADDWVSDYPFTGVPAMNALFRGARTIYNGTGDFYREPMEIVSAEYSWNFRSNGFLHRSAEECRGHQTSGASYILKETSLRNFSAPANCTSGPATSSTGPEAGPIMAAYYRESANCPTLRSPTRTAP